MSFTNAIAFVSTPTLTASGTLGFGGLQSHIFCLIEF
jgi:hypothetical protein